MTQSKKKIGRPTVMTDIVIAKLEEAFSLGCSDLEACIHAGISKQSLYDYQKLHPEFTDRKELLKERTVLKARTVLAKAINEGNVDRACWLLERKKKQEFSTKVETENVNHNVQMDTSELNLSDKEKKEYSDMIKNTIKGGNQDG